MRTSQQFFFYPAPGFVTQNKTGICWALKNISWQKYAGYFWAKLKIYILFNGYFY